MSPLSLKEHKSLKLLQNIKDQPFSFDRHRTVSLLNVCAKQKDVASGCRLHAEISALGLDKEATISCTLIDMYARCGCLATAHGILFSLHERDASTWTSLMGGYVRHGFCREALACYEMMRWEKISPSPMTLLWSLKACCISMNCIKGQAIHAESASLGWLEKGNNLRNMLIELYARSDHLADACSVFNKLPEKDAISWTALMTGYSKHGDFEEAVACFDKMQETGILPDFVTFVSTLKACSSLEIEFKCQMIHADIVKRGLLEMHIDLCNILVDSYASCALFEEAHEVLDSLPTRDVISWTALISGYVKHGYGNEALFCLEKMAKDDVSPNSVTYICSLKACSIIADMYKGKQLHVEASRIGLLEKDLTLGNTLIDMYSESGLFNEAQEVFDQLHVRDIISWTALISGYINNDHAEKALQCFELMRDDGFVPDVATYVIILKACNSIGDIEKGIEIHSEICKKGLLLRYTILGNALIDMYAKYGMLITAEEIFDNLPVHDSVSWNSLISGYVKYKESEEALRCLERTRYYGINLDVVSFVYGLRACGNLGAADKGSTLHEEISRKGLLEQEPLVGNALIEMYANCGLVAKAQEVFDQVPFRDIISWTELVSGYAQLGETETVFNILRRMNPEHEKPNVVTFLSVLNACSHAGLVDTAYFYFEIMSKENGINPSIEHVTCVADLLGRAGQVDKALAVITQMPFHPNCVACHSVLGACRKYGDVEMGKEALCYAIGIDDSDSGAYFGARWMFKELCEQQTIKQ